MKRVSVLLSALCLALGMTGMAVAAPLVVAHDTNFKPFEFKDSSGQYTGFDIELWDNVAKRAGLEYKFQPMDFNGIIPGLQTGNIDAAIAAMTITPQRQEVVDMSDPYYDTGIMLVVRTEDVDKYKSLEDLAGKVIASKTGTAPADYLRTKGACAIVKGLRAVSDFEYEFQMSLANKMLNPEAETVFFTAAADNMYLSSSIVKQIASFGGDISNFVPACILEEIQERLSRK